MSAEALPSGEPVRRLLIVDDDHDFALSLARLLHLEEYEVSVAHDGRSALAAVGRADVALVDIRLGHEDGVQLAGELTRLKPDLLVVMVTAHASVQTAIKALRAGIYDYVCKPFESDDMIATLARCFDRLHLARERAEARELLLRSRRMEAVGRLSAGIAHDFSNLLAVIGGNLRLVQEELARGAQGDGAILRELVEDALSAVQDGIGASRQLLAVGRAQPLLPRRLELGATMTQAARSVRRALRAGIALDVNPPRVPCLVEADPHQLEAGVLNLILNAQDALTGEGWIRLSADIVDLPEDCVSLLDDMRPGRYARLLVEDNGCGMTQDVTERALHPFFSTKPTERGSGLGLATVYGFVRQSGGNLILDSAPGVGTRISLLLPAAPDIPLPDAESAWDERMRDLTNP